MNNKIKYKSVHRLGSNDLRGEIRAGIIPRKKSSEQDFLTSEYAILCVSKGSGTYTDDKGNTHHFTSPCILQRFPGRKHSITWETDGETAYLAAPFEVYNLLQRTCKTSKLFTPVLYCSSPIEFYNETNYIIEILIKLPENQLIIGLNRIIAVFTNILIDENKTLKLLEQADEFIEKRLPGKISVEELTAHFAMSRSSFRDKFIQEAGTPPGRYIINKRLSMAASMLINNELSIGEISVQCSYPDIYTFSRQFKKFYGITPSQYRQGPEM